MDSLRAIVTWAYPPPGDRAVLDNPAAFALVLLPFGLHLLSMHLLLHYHRSPLANALRTGVLMPLAILASIRAGLGTAMPRVRYGPNPNGTRGKAGISWQSYTAGGLETEGASQHMNANLGTVCGASILKALELGLATRPPRLRAEMLDILRAERRREAAMNGKAQGRTEEEKEKEKEDVIGPDYVPPYFPGTRIPLALELLTNMRGIGWAWGLPFAPGCLPSPRPPAASPASRALQARRAALIRSALALALRLLLLIDIVDSLLKSPALFGPRANVGGPLALGGADAEGLRYEELARWQCALLTLLTGAFIPLSMQANASLLTAAALLPSYLVPESDWVWRYTLADPAMWSVRLFGRPHAAAARDLRTLWGREWHAFFRGPFLALAYRPVDGALKAVAGLGADAAAPTRRMQDPLEARASTAAIHSVERTGAAARPASPGKAKPCPWRGPPGTLLRRALAVLAVFLASGLLHELAQLAMGRTHTERDVWRVVGRGEPIRVFVPDAAAVFGGGGGLGEEAKGAGAGGGRRLAYIDRGGRCVFFFLMQGIGCVLEDVLEALVSSRGGRSLAGRTRPRPGRARLWAWVRWVWVCGWVFGFGHHAARAWLRMGLAQGVVSLRATGALAQLIWGATHGAPA